MSIDESTQEVNLGTNDNPKIIFISTNLESEEATSLVVVLQEFSMPLPCPKDMPGLDPSLVEHYIVLKPDARAVKQKLR